MLQNVDSLKVKNKEIKTKEQFEEAINRLIYLYNAIDENDQSKSDKRNEEIVAEIEQIRLATNEYEKKYR